MLAPVSRWLLPPLVVLAVLAGFRVLMVGREPPAIVLPRSQPLAIAAERNDPRVVTDEQLASVLARVLPPAGPVNTNNLVHALRLWGPSAEFDRQAGGVPGASAVLTGQQLRAYFLDDATFRRLAGDNAPPLFYRRAADAERHRGRSSQKVEVRSFDDQMNDRQTSSYHTDDLLATLAEIGTPLEATLRMRDGDATVRDLLESALGRFHLEQLEVEWTAIAYARYVFPEPGWRNQYGQRIDVDQLVTRLVSQPPELGPCNGLHRLEALVVLARVDEQFTRLRPATRRAMLNYMEHASRQLVAAQAPEGYWTRQWPQGSAAVDSLASHPPTPHDKLLVTGHHLEWLALAPDEVQPPRETVIRAAQWLSRALVEMDERELSAAYGPYTHAARALCLWRGTEAWEAWQRLHAADSRTSLAATE
jgi:hypothetical protein